MLIKYILRRIIPIKTYIYIAYLECYFNHLIKRLSIKNALLGVQLPGVFTGASDRYALLKWFLISTWKILVAYCIEMDVWGKDGFFNLAKQSSDSLVANRRF